MEDDVKALVVDDSKAMRQYVRSVLAHLPDTTVAEVDSGFEAFRILARKQFDLVITDINMPDINGLELIRFLKRSDRHQGTKIVVITTLNKERTAAKVEMLGVDRFLAKPFEPDALTEVVTDLLSGEPTGGSTKGT